MKPVDQHRADVLDGVQALSPLELQLLDSLGCTLVSDVLTDHDLPAFDNSSMDGYAVRQADVAAAGVAHPIVLPVVGDIPAGSSKPLHVAVGQCARIMTGAPLPAGADAVVPVEWTDGGVAQVRIDQAPAVGQYVRRRGEDSPAGTVVVTAGTRLGPVQIGVLAAAGVARVLVRPRPRVVVLSTGDELVEPGVELAAGQIHESNSFMLAAAARESGAQSYRVGFVADDPRALMDTLEDQLIRADLILTTGGVSVGAYDVVKEALTRLGTVSFDKVAMQPGMPQGHGVIGPDRIPIFTLPGNPVSAYVSFEVFVRPVLRRMMALEPLDRPSVRAVLTESVDSPAGKRQYLRARLEVADGRYVATPVGGPGSHLLVGLSRANALVVVPEDVTHAPAGDAVTVMVLERRLG